MNELTVFSYRGKEVRAIIDENGNPWFIGNEICNILEYANSRKAIADHCKHVKLLKGNESLHLTDSPRGISIIPESDLYRLIMRSKLPSAEKFQDWVTEEVLPTIRKTGSYSSKPKTVAEQLLGQAQLLVEMESRLNKIEERIEKQGAHLSTKADLVGILPETNPKTLRANLNQILRTYAQNNNLDYHAPWIELYREFYYRNNCNLSVRAKNAKMKILDYAEQEGILEDLAALATEMFC